MKVKGYMFSRQFTLCTVLNPKWKIGVYQILSTNDR